MSHRIALVRHAQPAESAVAPEIERVSNDPMYPSVRIDFFLDRDLLVRVGAHPATRADVESFSVLTNDDEVDVVAGAVFQGRSGIVRRAHAQVVHSQVELE